MYEIADGLGRKAYCLRNVGFFCSLFSTKKPTERESLGGKQQSDRMLVGGCTKMAKEDKQRQTLTLQSYAPGPLSCSLRKELFSLISCGFLSYYNHLLSSEADTADERCCSSSSAVATLYSLYNARDLNHELHHQSVDKDK